MNVAQYRMLFAAAIAAFIVVLAMWIFQARALEDADFYECPPGNSLHVCKVGTGPPNAECVSVGSGQTTIAPRNCG